ncbi:hypothetical protein [Aquamicrobium soli]|jgi:hypothetical protein|uniref:Flagellar biosynthesis protein FliO n=1 Tax=Aquamicrobium soli TaxID=1811518 RepID=A0ABV7KFX8_9HYPH
MDWLDGIAGPDFARAVLWTVVALIVLVIVLVIVRLIRSMTFGTFVAGGRNRKTRLAVMDATAIDSHRRLVLVRRDDIEHLLLIGGPTDVVVERDIRMAAPRRPAATAGGPPPSAAQKPHGPQQPPTPQPPRSTLPPRGSLAAGGPQAGHGHSYTTSTSIRHDEAAASGAAEPRLAPVAANEPRSAHAASASAFSRPTGQKPAHADDGIDETFASELEVSLGDFSTDHEAELPKAAATPDDEMAKLLGELASHKR